MSGWPFAGTQHASLNSTQSYNHSHLNHVGSTSLPQRNPREASLFYQDQQYNDELFYNTFPAAREALAPTAFVFARSTRGLGRSGKLDPIVTQPTDLGVQYKSYTLLSPLEDRCPPLPMKVEAFEDSPAPYSPLPAEQTVYAPESAYGSSSNPEPVMDFLESPDHQPCSRPPSSGPASPPLKRSSQSSTGAPSKYLSERRSLGASQKRGKRKMTMVETLDADSPKDKPRLACFFCRGRKIACGPPDPDSPDQTCNQCARRSLCCKYPEESRRGIRKTKAEKEKEKHLSEGGLSSKGRVTPMVDTT